MLMGFCTSPLRPASESLAATLAESPGGMMFFSNSAVVHPQAGWTFLISRSAEPVFLRMNVCSTDSGIAASEVVGGFLALDLRCGDLGGGCG